MYPARNGANMLHGHGIDTRRLFFKKPFLLFIAVLITGLAVNIYVLFLSPRTMWLLLFNIAFFVLLAVAAYACLLFLKKESDKSVSIQQAYYHGILASRHESFFVIDRNFLIRDVSAGFLKKTGIRRADAIGRPCHVISRDRATPCYTDKGNQCPVEYVFSTGKRKSCVQRHMRPNHDPMEIEVTAAPLRKEGGEVVLAVETVRDITELSHLKVLFMQAQKMEAVGRLAGGMAHDFNNLMNVVIGHAEMLLGRHHNDEYTRRGLENILKAGESASALTRQLLAFSRKQIMEPRILDLNIVIGNMALMLRRIIGEDIELVSLPADGLWLVKADMMMMEQVIMNLAVNARDAMPAGGRLIIETKNVELDDYYVKTHHGARPGRYVMLSVSDTGIGMTPEVKARIFEPFFTTKEPGKGTGLGLSTVFGIVKQHGGYVMTYSEPGMGTTFKIYIPVAEVEPQADDMTSQSIPRGTEKILLVEDDEGVRTMAAMMLEELGYEVIACSSGDEALRLLRSGVEDPDLLLTDVVMPGMSGRQLAENALELKPDMKVLFMSGYSDNAIAGMGVIGPGARFIQKPFASSAIARKIREVLNE